MHCLWRVRIIAISQGVDKELPGLSCKLFKDLHMYEGRFVFGIPKECENGFVHHLIK